MSSLIEKTFMLGLGALTLTREKVVQLVDDLVKAGEVKAEESKSLAEKLIAKGREEQKALRKLVRQELEQARPVSRKEFEALSRKVERLAKLVDQPTGKKTTKKETPGA